MKNTTLLSSPGSRCIVKTTTTKQQLQQQRWSRYSYDGPQQVQRKSRINLLSSSSSWNSSFLTQISDDDDRHHQHPGINFRWSSSQSSPLFLSSGLTTQLISNKEQQKQEQYHSRLLSSSIRGQDHATTITSLPHDDDHNVDVNADEMNDTNNGKNNNKVKESSTNNNNSIIKSYMELSKARLSTLVVSTTLAGYIAVGPDAIYAIDISPSILISCLIGTALCSSSAAAYNQIFEISRDRLMKRTMYRPLVTGQLSQSHAISLATLWGISGTSILYYGTDPITASLGLGNIILYAGLYTYLKPISIYNTWIGAIVGAIPPWMGWTAASSAVAKATTATKTTTAATTIASAATIVPTTAWFVSDTSTVPDYIMLTSSSLPPLDVFIDHNLPGLLLAFTLYYWQLPHFMALSYMHRMDYERGGFQMLPSVESQQQQEKGISGNGDYNRTANVMVRNTWYLSTIPFIATITNVTSSMYALEGILLNSYALYVAYQFKYSKTNANARKVFLTSLWYLPCTLMLFLLHSKVFHIEEVEINNTNKITNDDIEHNNDEYNDMNNRNNTPPITIGKLVSNTIYSIRDIGKGICIHEAVIASHNNNIDKAKTNDSSSKDSCPVIIGSNKVNEATTLVVHEVLELQQDHQQQQQTQHQKEEQL